MRNYVNYISKGDDCSRKNFENKRRVYLEQDGWDISCRIMANIEYCAMGTNNLLFSIFELYLCNLFSTFSHFVANKNR